MRRHLVIFSLFAGCAAAPLLAGDRSPETPAAQAPKPGPALGSYGFDATGMDASVAPGDSFYDYANAVWAKRTPIPDDKSNYGMFTALQDLSQQRVRGLLDSAKDQPGSRIGAAYASFLDDAAVEKRGLAPIASWLGEVRGLKDHQGYAALSARAARNGVGSLFAGFVAQDDKNPDAYIFQMAQAGLGMPDRDFYLLDTDKMKATRAAYADVLPDAVAKENFAFYGTTINGTPAMQPRWKRAVDFTSNILTDEVSKVYVAEYFPPESKAAMEVLVGNVLTALGKRIDRLDWMQPATKAKAQAKLKAFKTRIGYPEQWHDYSAMKIDRGDLFGNAVAANNWGHDWNIGKLGKPIYRWEWGLDPMTVNAQANFQLVAITFPAAILQPPFFDPAADPAINYGGIGAVIGHEISHHFDDQGAKYDAGGRLADWWSEQDVANFKRLSQELVKQYDAYEIFPGEHLKGEFTLGENIGDLAGLHIAYDAYKASLGGKPAPVLEGMSGDQRFFLGWAQVWRRNYREANLRSRIFTDPHAPSVQRVAVVRNMDAWYSAFSPAAGQKLFLKPEERVRIW